PSTRSPTWPPNSPPPPSWPDSRVGTGSWRTAPTGSAMSPSPRTHPRCVRATRPPYSPHYATSSAAPCEKQAGPTPPAPDALTPTPKPSSPFTASHDQTGAFAEHPGALTVNVLPNTNQLSASDSIKSP